MIDKEEIQKNVRNQLDQAIVKGKKNVSIYPSSNSAIEKDMIKEYLNELGYEIDGFQGDKSSIISYFVDLYKPRKQPLYDATDRPFRSFEQWVVNHQNREQEKIKEMIDEINKQIKEAYAEGKFNFNVSVECVSNEAERIKAVSDYILSLGLVFSTPFRWDLYSNTFNAIVSVPKEYQTAKRRKKERKKLWRR